MGQPLGLFSPEMQALFWRNLEPDMSETISRLENKESWTHDYNDFPLLFSGMELLAKERRDKNASEMTDSECRALIKLISAMPFGKSISALSFIDMSHNHKEGMGMTSKLFLEASKIYKNNADDPLNKEAKVIYERIKTFSKSKLFTELFTNDSRLGN